MFGSRFHGHKMSQVRPLEHCFYIILPCGALPVGVIDGSSVGDHRHGQIPGTCHCVSPGTARRESYRMFNGAGRTTSPIPSFCIPAGILHKDQEPFAAISLTFAWCGCRCFLTLRHDFAACSYPNVLSKRQAPSIIQCFQKSTTGL